MLKPGRHDQTSIFGLPLPTKQRHTSYQHSSANLPTLLRQQGSYRALRHSPTKETQAPTSEQKPKPFLSLSAVRKVRPGKHEGGATRASTGYGRYYGGYGTITGNTRACLPAQLTKTRPNKTPKAL